MQRLEADKHTLSLKRKRPSSSGVVQVSGGFLDYWAAALSSEYANILRLMITQSEDLANSAAMRRCPARCRTASGAARNALLVDISSRNAVQSAMLSSLVLTKPDRVPQVVASARARPRGTGACHVGCVGCRTSHTSVHACVPAPHSCQRRRRAQRPRVPVEPGRAQQHADRRDDQRAPGHRRVRGARAGRGQERPQVPVAVLPLARARSGRAAQEARRVRRHAGHRPDGRTRASSSCVRAWWWATRRCARASRSPRAWPRSTRTRSGRRRACRWATLRAARCSRTSRSTACPSRTRRSATTSATSRTELARSSRTSATRATSPHTTGMTAANETQDYAVEEQDTVTLLPIVDYRVDFLEDLSAPARARRCPAARRAAAPGRHHAHRVRRLPRALGRAPRRALRRRRGARLGARPEDATLRVFELTALALGARRARPSSTTWPTRSRPARQRLDREREAHPHRRPQPAAHAHPLPGLPRRHEQRAALL